MQTTFLLPFILKQLNLPEGFELFIGRHGNCGKAQNDADRVLSLTGTQATVKTGQTLTNKGFNPEFAIVSPAIRTQQTASILFPNAEHVLYAPFYDFEAFPSVERLYKNHAEPVEYVTADPEEVEQFVKNFTNFIKPYVKENSKLAIVNHAIISNFTALAFAAPEKALEASLEESTGFLITKDSFEVVK